MAQTPPPRPRPRGPADRHRAPDRLLALAGVAGLLLVLVVSVTLVLSAVKGDGDEPESTASASATAEATETPTATATAKPKPTPVPLTASQRAERTKAADVVRSRGFKVVRLRDYDPRDTLRVLIGRSTSGGELAFFFVQGDYIGNDGTSLSERMKVKGTGDLTTTITYAYAQPSTDGGDATIGRQDVRFTWDGNRLSPDQALPPSSQRAPGALPG
jgi:LppP/LprE lipoprotein